MRAGVRLQMIHRRSLKLTATLAVSCAACAAAVHAQAPSTTAQPSISGQQEAAPLAVQAQTPAISEDELKQQFLGKTFYLRGGYLDNTLHFDEKGRLDGASPQASYTLSLVEITRVRLGKRHLDLEGDRYGLHFLGALPTEDQSAAFDKVRLTSKKKPLRIAIDREVVVKPKKETPHKKNNGDFPQPGAVFLDAPPAQQEHKDTAETTSTEHANHALQAALDRIFSSGIDARMITTLPDYWQLYYKAVATKSDFRPSDPAVLRPSQVDRKAKLLTVFEPPSNDYAQHNGVAGIAMYHVIVGADGKPGQIAVGRPIGFGLDESAVASLRKASFQPALKDGKPVPVVLDLLVQFRIYSNRTGTAPNAAANPAPARPPAPALPGPYSVEHPQ